MRSVAVPVRVRVPAKINLRLAVGDLRRDGGEGSSLPGRLRAARGSGRLAGHRRRSLHPKRIWRITDL